MVHARKEPGRGDHKRISLTDKVEHRKKVFVGKSERVSALEV